MQIEQLYKNEVELYFCNKCGEYALIREEVLSTGEAFLYCQTCSRRRYRLNLKEEQKMGDMADFCRDQEVIGETEISEGIEPREENKMADVATRENKIIVKKITEQKTKPAGKGTIYSVGIMATDNKWYNINEWAEEDADAIADQFEEGKAYKVTEVSTDAEHKWWKISKGELIPDDQVTEELKTIAKELTSKKDEPSTHWGQKTIFLNSVSGDKIVAEQEKINSADGTFIVATQIFPRDKSNIKDVDEKILMLYDAFIYYKEKPKGE